VMRDRWAKDHGLDWCPAGCIGAAEMREPPYSAVSEERIVKGRSKEPRGTNGLCGHL